MLDMTGGAAVRLKYISIRLAQHLSGVYRYSRARTHNPFTTCPITIEWAGGQAVIIVGLLSLI